MPSLGIGQTLTKSSLVTPGIIRDNLVLKHNYTDSQVVPVSDGAAYFDSTDDYISVSETTLSVHDTAYSFAFWVNLKDTGWHPIFGDDDAFYNTIAIDDDNDRIIIEGNIDGSNMQWNTLQDPLVLGAWNHFAICMDGSGSGKAYQNGVELTITNDTIGSDLIFKYIGKGSSYFLGGYLCNIGIWSSTLTQPQVKSIMNKNYAGLSDSEKTNLVSWWNLDSTISEDYNATSETDDSPSTINGMVLDNNDTTFTEVSVTNSDFTSGSGTSITGWTNTAANKWEISGSTIISPNGVSLISQAVLTNNITHKAIVRAKNTVPGSTSRLKVYFGANNNAQYELTDDFQEYVFHGYQDNDTTFFLYNESGAASTNVTIDWVKLYKYDGNVGVLV